MLHNECEEGKRLLESYLLALASHDEIVRLECSETHGLEVAVSRESLAIARGDYWNHVHRHKCRVEKDGRKDVEAGEPASTN